MTALIAYSTDVYKSYDSLGANIDGDIRTFKVSGSTEHTSSNYNTVSRSIYTESTATVNMPLDYLRKMVTGGYGLWPRTLQYAPEERDNF